MTDQQEPATFVNGQTHSNTNGNVAAPHEEEQYLNLIREIMDRGQIRPDRTGTGTLSLFAPPSMRFSLADMALPLLTTKRVFMRGVLEELLWFVRGSTHNSLLQAKDVHIWDGNGSRAYLDKIGLHDRDEGDLGPVYGFQWRHFGARYKGAGEDYTGQGVDQLAECIRKIKENPTDRRIIMSAWNPADIPIMALPPCHMFCQFYVTLPSTSSSKPQLSCLMYQRSADLGLGIPFNIASYALLTHMVARVTGTEALELVMQLGDAHVYRDHVEALSQQIQRSPRPFPSLKWSRDDIEDIDSFRTEDFVVQGYKPHPKLEMKMSV
ncbi:MAG: Thymidylate synthase [Cyphobasidiales sp. Tagirdzhanova-0007]|nr:MAG: Thymidylate synthase [Cyphobasidiales sp. Tagirdzhanova-0007]